MKTKSGQAVPRGLAGVLHKGKSMLVAWGQMRSSSQKELVVAIEKAGKDPAKQRKALEKVATATKKFGKRHSDKRQNRGPA